MAKTAQAVIETKVKDGASAGFRKVDKAMKNTAKQGKVLNQQFRFMRGGLGQVGHQVQDVAVQLQMGQNAMLVFGQQGSQIASLFGPGGAMFGAVIAIGAALSMSLAPAFFGATEAAKELKDANKELIDSFDELSPAQQAFARVLADKKLKEYREELERLNKVSRDRLTIQKTGGFFDKFKAKKGDLESLNAYNERIAKLASDTAFYKAAIKSLESQVDGITTAFQKQDDSLKTQIATFGMSSLAVQEYEIRQQVLREELSQTEGLQLLMHLAGLKRLEEAKAAKDAEAAQEESRLGVKDKLIETLDLELAKAQAVTQSNLEARISVADLTEEERSLIQAKMDKLQLLDQEKAKKAKLAAWEKKSATEKGAHLAGEAAKSFGAFAHNSKKAARLQKTVQVAQAIMNTITGATAALDDYPVPINFAMAAMTVAQGMGMVSQIKSQSFDGGGFTGNGTRQGGVDGKGGFNAILHPNETVIDHTKGQSMGGVVVNQSFNISTGVEQTVRAEIQNLMPQITNITKNAVAEAKMRGGAYSKQLVGA